jgi:indole-3-glycerol phosphate synthase
VTATQPTFLADLVAGAARQTAERRRARSEAELGLLVQARPLPQNFAAALRGRELAVIAEMKPRDPAQGRLTEFYRPTELAHAYQRGGAAAVSVLTHEEGFGGRPEDIPLVRAETDLPLLCKDIVIDEYQLLEARSLGADAVSLTAAALPLERLAQLMDYTRALGMEALVEVHDAGEVDAALMVGARVIGVNHRDLRTIELDMTLSRRLRDRIGRDRMMVGESGVRTPEDARHLRAAGADAILVGRMLMRAPDPASAIKELARS